MNEERILELVGFSEQSFYRYHHDYGFGFEQGVIYDNNGKPESIEFEDLKQEVHDIMCNLEDDCKNLLDSRNFQKVRDNLNILERLEMLNQELAKNDYKLKIKKEIKEFCSGKCESCSECIEDIESEGDEWSISADGLNETYKCRFYAENKNNH